MIQKPNKDFLYLKNQKLKRKSQISFYILIGVLLLIILTTFSYLQSYQIEEEISNFNPVSVYIDACLKQSANNELLLLGNSGGVSNADNFILANLNEVPIFDKGYNLDSELLLKNYEATIINSFNGCIGDFSDLKNQGYSFELFDKDLFVNSNMNIDLSYPIKVTKSDTTKAYSKFSTNLNYDIDKLVNITNTLLSEIWLSESIPLSTMVSLHEIYGVDIDAYDFENHIVYVIEDSSFSYLGENFKFMFAVEVVYYEE